MNDFQSLVDAYLDETINNDELVVLNEFLHDHPDRIREFAVQVHHQCLLQFTYGLDSGPLNGIQPELSPSFSNDHEDVIPSRFMPVSSRRLLSRTRRALLWTVGVGVLLLAVQFFLTSKNPGDPARDITVADPVDIVVPQIGPLLRPLSGAAHVQLAVIEAATQDTSHEYPIGREFFVGDRIQIEKGQLSLRFRVGVTAVVSAPAELEFVSPMKAILRSGRVTAAVEEQARGFTLVTPGANIVDLGTRFGVSANGNGDSDVVVFEGSVDVHYRSSDGTERKECERIYEGSALRIHGYKRIGRLKVIQKGAKPYDWSTELTDPECAIAGVTDNFIEPEQSIDYYVELRKFDEDALAYIDRPYEWNSLPGVPFPEPLRGASYIQTLNQLKYVVNLQIHMKVRKDADVYVLMDRRVSPPMWLREGFEKTDLLIGMDEIRKPESRNNFVGLTQSELELGVGPGKSVDFEFCIWKRSVPADSIVTFGDLLGDLLNASSERKLTPDHVNFLKYVSMYGIVVVPHSH